MGGEHRFHSTSICPWSLKTKGWQQKTKFTTHYFLVRALNSTIHHSLSPNLLKKMSLILSETEKFSKSKMLLLLQWRTTDILSVKRTDWIYPILYCFNILSISHKNCWKFYILVCIQSSKIYFILTYKKQKFSNRNENFPSLVIHTNFMESIMICARSLDDFFINIQYCKKFE